MGLMFATLHFLELSPTARPLLTSWTEGSFSVPSPGAAGRSLGGVSRVPPGAFTEGVWGHSESIFQGPGSILELCARTNET